MSVEEAPGDSVRFYQEGLVSTVKVIQRAADGRQRVMLVDGVGIGQSSAGIDNKQQVLAHFPFLLRPGRPPARVLSIGLGTGIVKALAQQLGAQVETLVGPAGTTVSITHATFSSKAIRAAQMAAMSS